MTRRASTPHIWVHGTATAHFERHRPLLQDRAPREEATGAFAEPSGGCVPMRSSSSSDRTISGGRSSSAPAGGGSR